MYLKTLNEGLDNLIKTLSENSEILKEANAYNKAIKKQQEKAHDYFVDGSISKDELAAYENQLGVNYFNYADMHDGTLAGKQGDLDSGYVRRNKNQKSSWMSAHGNAESEQDQLAIREPNRLLKLQQQKRKKNEDFSDEIFLENNEMTCDKLWKTIRDLEDQYNWATTQLIITCDEDAADDIFNGCKAPKDYYDALNSIDGEYDTFNDVEIRLIKFNEDDKEDLGYDEYDESLNEAEAIYHASGFTVEKILDKILEAKYSDKIINPLFIHEPGEGFIARITDWARENNITLCKLNLNQLRNIGDAITDDNIKNSELFDLTQRKNLVILFDDLNRLDQDQLDLVAAISRRSFNNLDLSNLLFCIGICSELTSNLNILLHSNFKIIKLDESINEMIDNTNETGEGRVIIPVRDQQGMIQSKSFNSRRNIKPAKVFESNN